MTQPRRRLQLRFVREVGRLASAADGTRQPSFYRGAKPPTSGGSHRNPSLRDTLGGPDRRPERQRGPAGTAAASAPTRPRPYRRRPPAGGICEGVFARCVEAGGVRTSWAPTGEVHGLPPSHPIRWRSLHPPPPRPPTLRPVFPTIPPVSLPLPLPAQQGSDDRCAKPEEPPRRAHFHHRGSMHRPTGGRLPQNRDLCRAD